MWLLPDIPKPFTPIKSAASGGNVSQFTVYLLNDYGAAVEKTMVNQAGAFIEKKANFLSVLTNIRNGFCPLLRCQG